MLGEFDTLTLKLRADKWRDEAARTPAAAMRVLYLHEAYQCERRLWGSTNTPIIHERGIESGWSAKGAQDPHTLHTSR
jgi:hypothetical protein